MTEFSKNPDRDVNNNPFWTEVETLTTIKRCDNSFLMGTHCGTFKADKYRGELVISVGGNAIEIALNDENGKRTAYSVSFIEGAIQAVLQLHEEIGNDVEKLRNSRSEA